MQYMHYKDMSRYADLIAASQKLMNTHICANDNG